MVNKISKNDSENKVEDDTHAGNIFFSDSVIGRETHFYKKTKKQNCMLLNLFGLSLLLCSCRILRHTKNTTYTAY